MAARKKVLSVGVLVRHPKTQEVIFLEKGTEPGEFKAQISSEHFVSPSELEEPKKKEPQKVASKTDPNVEQVDEEPQAEEQPAEEVDPENDFGTE